MLDGRVKTIHPRIAGGILAMRSKPEHMRALAEHGIPPIDLVVVNLYEFEKDRGQEGRAARGADREYRYRRSDHDPRRGQELAGCRGGDFAADYAAIVEELHGGRRIAFRGNALAAGQEGVRDHGGLRPRGQRAPGRDSSHAAKRCRRCSTSARRARWRCATARIRTSRRRSMRPASAGIAGAEQLHGKELSYNNLVDLDAAWQLILEFDQPGVGHHQAHQSVRLRGGRDAGRKLSPGIRSRSGVGVRRRAGIQPRGG